MATETVGGIFFVIYVGTRVFEIPYKFEKTTTFEWHSRFKSGRESVKDDPHPGRPSTSKIDENVDLIKSMVMENRRLTIREMVDEVGISFGSIQSILSDDLGLTRLAAKLVPKSLNVLQRQERVIVAKKMLSNVDADPTFIQRIMSGDETWVYAYDTLTKQQSRHEPRPKKIRQTQSNKKILLTVFIDYRGVVHHEFLPTGHTVNKEYYLGVMRRLREAVRLKRPDLWENNSWILHHDNAPSHTAMVIREFLAKNSTNTVHQPPYSSDLAPCDFFLFSRLKNPLRGTRFDSIEAIKEKSKKELMAIPKSEYEKCFQDWIKRWHKCIASDGEYFEGDKINIDE